MFIHSYQQTSKSGCWHYLFAYLK